MILEQIHRAIGNLVQTFNTTKTYIYEDDPCSGILAAEALAIRSTTNRLKVYSPGQLVFDRDTIIPLKHKVNWKLIRQQK